MPNILPILIVFVLFFLGVPVAFAMLIASFIYFTFMCDGVNMFTMVSSLLTNSESFTMLASSVFCYSRNSYGIWWSIRKSYGLL